MGAVDFLGNVSIFTHMKKRDLKRIASQVQTLTFKKGDVIIKEGEKGTKLYIIMRGEVEVVKDLASDGPHRLHASGPRSYFGEMALWDDLVRTASVVATRDTEVLCLDRFDFRKAVEKYPGLAIELLQMLNRRILALEKKLSEFGDACLPRCSKCGHIRLEDGSWVPLEGYIASHAHSDPAQLFCDRCAE
jgi:CRP-like cAMP-binding protein